MINEQIEKPWYLQPYVWLVIAFPLSAVIAGIITIWIAVESDDGLVVDDYYKRGLEINRTLERDEIAGQYQLKTVIQTNYDDKKIMLTLTGNQSFSAPPAVSVKFMHATRGGFDKELTLKLGELNTYHGTLPELIRGKWHVMVEANNWRVLNTLFVK